MYAIRSYYESNGEMVTVNIGEDEKDPVFCVTDLLPHLATEQMKRTLSEGIKGEELNILIVITSYSIHYTKLYENRNCINRNQ